MEKKIGDYLNLYIGCEVEYGFDGRKSIGTLTGYVEPFGWQVSQRKVLSPYLNISPAHIKPILRPLSDMTEGEMTEVIKILFSDVDDKIDDDELQLEMFYWDDSTMVDGDVQVGANISCRCFEGQLAIRECGSFHLFDEKGELQRLSNVPAAVNYLRKNHFDCDQLIESSLAISKHTKE